MNKKIKPIFEFLLWDNCYNDCKFCYLKLKYNPLTIAQKITSIEKAEQFLQSSAYVSGSHVLLVGGEIFDDRQIFDRLFLLFDFVVNKMLDGSIDILYVNTNLIYKDTTALDYLINLIGKHNLYERLKFTTSYDVDGRFKNNAAERLMLSNLKRLNTLYPQLRTVVNIILSKKMCENIINDVFSVSSFCDHYGCKVNLLPYIVLTDDVSASRSLIFKTLRKVDQQIPGYIQGYVYNFNLPQPKELYKFNHITEQYDYCSSVDLECGHSENFTKYSEKGTCYVCDLNKVFGDYQ